jgi:hypothetical protein
LEKKIALCSELNFLPWNLPSDCAVGSNPATIVCLSRLSVAPYIDAKNLHDVTVIAGDRVKFDLRVFGEPGDIL